LVQNVNNFILAKIGKRNMKKSFQKTLIAAAVLAAAGTASANSLLFPYFTTATGAQSVLSISANGTVANVSTAGVISSAERLHYVYNYGSTCTHYDGNGYVTKNDVLQHSVADPAFGGFGKVQASDASAPFYLTQADTTGFLTVTNMGQGTAGVVTGASINGEMAIIDPASGLVVSYAGITNTTATTTLAEGDFSGVVDNAFELSWYPSNLVTTSFYGVVVGNFQPAIAAGRDWKGFARLTNNGNVWANDEVGRSGTSTKDILCSGTFVPSDLMSSATANWIGTNAGLIRATSITTSGLSATGGLATQQVTGTTYDAATGLVVVKLQKILPAAGLASGTTVLHRVPVANN